MTDVISFPSGADQVWTGVPVQDLVSSSSFRSGRGPVGSSSPPSPVVSLLRVCHSLVKGRSSRQDVPDGTGGTSRPHSWLRCVFLCGTDHGLYPIPRVIFIIEE